MNCTLQESNRFNLTTKNPIVYTLFHRGIRLDTLLDNKILLHYFKKYIIPYKSKPWKPSKNFFFVNIKLFICMTFKTYEITMIMIEWKMIIMTQWWMVMEDEKWINFHEWMNRRMNYYRNGACKTSLYIFITYLACQRSWWRLPP